MDRTATEGMFLVERHRRRKLLFQIRRNKGRKEETIVFSCRRFSNDKSVVESVSISEPWMAERQGKLSEIVEVTTQRWDIVKLWQL